MTTDESIITYVNPYKLPESNNSELISLLQNGNTSNNQTTTLNFNIPVFKSIDVSNLIDLNNNKIESQINEQKDLKMLISIIWIAIKMRTSHLTNPMLLN